MARGLFWVAVKNEQRGFQRTGNKEVGSGHQKICTRIMKWRKKDVVLKRHKKKEIGTENNS